MLKIVIFFLLYIVSLHKQCVGIPGLKTVMSHVHKSVTFGVILNKLSIFSSHEVSRRSRYGG